MTAEDEDDIADYLDEARSYMDELNEHLMAIEADPSIVREDESVIKDTFRAAHSLKGLSAAFGFGRTNELIHKVEFVLDEVRYETLELTSDVSVLLYKAMDLIESLFEEISNTRTETLDVSAMAKEIVDFLERAKNSEKPAEQVVDSPTASATAAVAAAPAREKEVSQAAVTETVRVGMDRLDRLMNLAGELVIARSRIVTLTQDLGGLEGIEGVERRAVSHDEVERIHSMMSGAMADLETVTSGIQDTVMEARMVSLDPIFRRFQRTVRDIANSLGKQIRLELQGVDTELDKRVTDELVNPLTHLVRNAADHGLESTKERLAAGKPEFGTITLRGSQRGTHVFIEVIDDGGGIDPETVKAKAVSRDLITAEESAKMTDSESYRLVFRPGFSTAAEVTDISGRGMGMDIVMSRVEALRGEVEVTSVRGQGTTFTVKLPLTLSILTCLLVKVRGEIFAIPLASIQELISIDVDERLSVIDQEVVVVRDDPIPLVRLDDVLAFRGDSTTVATEGGEFSKVVIVTTNAGLIGVVVDELLRKDDLVVKPLVGEMAVRGLSGSAILGDGRVTLILDPSNLPVAVA